MAKATKTTSKPATGLKADEMLVEPGMRFVAREQCHIGKLYNKGKPVPFSPGQIAPMNLVCLVEDAAQEEATSTENGASAQESQAENEDSLQGGDSGGAAPGGAGYTA